MSLLSASNLSMAFGERTLFSGADFLIETGDRIGLVGPNGCGKTTLLKSILGLIPSISGKVTLGDYLYTGYFEQEMSGSQNNTCIEELWQEFPAYTQYEVRSALAKCGLTTKHIESQVRVLSGGEQAKVRLCKLINKETNVLLLDEPTNHLDVDAKEELKQISLSPWWSVNETAVEVKGAKISLKSRNRPTRMQYFRLYPLTSLGGSVWSAPVERQI